MADKRDHVCSTAGERTTTPGGTAGSLVPRAAFAAGIDPVAARRMIETDMHRIEWNRIRQSEFVLPVTRSVREPTMGRYALLWLLGVPIPILILIWALGGMH
jgi:hypothetical protein